MEPDRLAEDRDGRFSSALKPEVLERLRNELGLTPREFSVVLHAMDGLTTLETARRLNCSRHTVNVHLRRVYFKLDVSNKASLIARLFVAYADYQRRRTQQSDEAPETG